MCRLPEPFPTCLSLSELQDAVGDVLPSLQQQGVRVFILSEECDAEGMYSLSDKIRQSSDQPLSPQLRANTNNKSPALYIYTSGTTGNPNFLLRHLHSTSNFLQNCIV